MDVFEHTHTAEIPFVRILVPFSLGILCAYQIDGPLLLKALLCLCIILFGCLFGLSLQRRRFGSYRYKASMGMLFHGLIFFSGCLSSTLYNQKFKSDYYAFKNFKYLKISVISEPVKRPNIIWFDAFVTKGYHPEDLSGPPKRNCSILASGKIRVALKPDTNTPLLLEYGTELIIPARVSETRPPDNPSEFDFKSWLAARNIYHQTSLKQKELICLKGNKGHKLIRYAFALREKQVSVYRKLIKNDDAFAVAATLILGYRSDLSAETLDTYAKTGTLHALSVSGMHVGLIYMILNWLLSFLDKRTGFKVLKMIVTLLLIWAYSLLTGFSPSVLRSALMLSVFIIAKAFNKTTNSYNIIAFAAFCLLLYNPFLIWDVGFQLSFLAVFGLIYLQPKIYAWLPLKNPWSGKIWNAAAMSIAAQLATYPLSIYYFHTFPIFFLFSNLFIMLPAALIMYLGIAILLFRLDSLAPLFEYLITFTNNCLNKIAGIPCSGISAIWISKTELVLLCISLACFTAAIQGFKKKLLLASLVIFLGFQTLLSYDKVVAMHQKKIIRFKLRQHYAVAFFSGNSALLYTDLTMESKNFKYFIKPALDQHKIERVKTFR